MKHAPRQFVQVVVAVALAAPNVFGQQSVPPSSTVPNATADDRTNAAPSPEPIPGLSLGWFLDAALAGNPSLAESRAKVAALRGKWTQVGLRTNPQLGYLANQVGAAGTPGMQGVFLWKQVITGNKLQLNRRAVSQEIQQAEQNWVIQETRVRNDVRLAFYRALVAQYRVKVAKNLAGIGDEIVRSAETRLKAREGSRTQLLQARVEADTIRLTLIGADNTLAAQWRQLTVLANVPQLQPQPLTGDVEADLPRIEWQTALDRLLTESPQIAAAAANVERARWQYQRELAGRCPDINTRLAVTYDHVPNDAVANVLVGVPLQIHDRNQGNIAAAHGQVRAAEAALARLELDLQNRLADVYGRYATAHEQAVRYSDKILPTALETLQLMQRAYKDGELDYLNVLNAQRTYSRATLDYLSALEQLWQAAVEIDGLLLSGSLNTVD